jgi:O-antigen/teichoic acid export membrane protein
VFWSLIEQFGSQGINMAVYFVLTLCLQPTDFGIVTMAGSWLALEAVFSELGFGAAIIQRKELNDDHLSTVFVINICSGVLLTGSSLILSWPCALFFKTPQVQPIMAALSFGFLIDAFSLTQRAILRRKMRFKLLAIRTILSLCVGGTVALVFAHFNFGVWSLVAFSLTNSVVGLCLFWSLSTWRPTIRRFSRTALRELWSYSSKMLLNGIFKSIFHSTDKILIGFFLGPASLGVYDFTNKILLQPTNKLSLAISNFLFPLYSRMQDNLQSIKDNYLVVNKVINSVIVPGIICGAFLLPHLVALWYGQKWALAIPVIKFVAIASISYTFIWPIGVLMKALNRPGWFLIWSIVFTALVAVAIMVFGKTGSLRWIMCGIAMSYTIMMTLSFKISNSLLNTSVGELVRTLLVSTIGNVGLAVSFFLLNHLPKFGHVWWVLGIETALMLGLYFCVIYYFDRKFISLISRKVKARVRIA